MNTYIILFLCVFEEATLGSSYSFTYNACFVASNHITLYLTTYIKKKIAHLVYFALKWHIYWHMNTTFKSSIEEKMLFLSQLPKCVMEAVCVRSEVS